MASTLLHMDAANLFVGDDAPTDGLFLRIKSLKLPDLEEKTKDHTGGGAMASIKIGMRVFDISAFTFKLEGYNPDIDSRFMPGSPRRINYTVRGNVSDIRDHTDIEIKATIGGRMTKVSNSEFERDKGTDSDYEINEILFYKVLFGNQEKIYFDWFAGPAGVRINGQPVAPALARNLGIA